MTAPDKYSWPWRTLWLIPVTLFAVLTIIATGGGGGDDGGGSNGGGDPGPVIILPTYNFFITNLPDDNLFTASVGSGLTVSIDIDGLLHNSVDLSVNAANEVTFLSYMIRASSSLDLVISSGDVFPFDGTIAVIVTEDITIDFDGFPTSGAFNVVTPSGTIAVTIVTGGVQLSLDGGLEIFYTWDEFGNLLDDETQEA